MDFKALQQFNRQQIEKRQSNNEVYLSQGYAHLDQFERSGYSDANSAKQACTHFIQALKLNTKDIQAYLMLAYLFLIVEEFETALNYSQSALAIAPDNPKALKLKQSIQNLKHEALQQPRTPTALNWVQDLKQSADFDKLYDQIESHIHAQVRQLATQAAIIPTIESERIVALQETLSQYQDELSRIQSQIKIVDQEIETFELRQSLKPLEAYLSRLQQNLRHSEHLRALKVKISQDQQRLNLYLNQVHDALSASELQDLERELEKLLDSNNEIADQLDQLSEQGHAIDLIESDYENLVQGLEKFRDFVDDQLEHL